MVHHTISNSSSSAPSASSRIRVMKRASRFLGAALIVGMLASCAVKPPPAPPPALPAEPAPPTGPVADSSPIGPAIQRARSRWVPVRWAELPGFEQDDTSDAWNAWIKSCERPGPTFAPLCSEVRRLSLGTPDEQRNWMKARLQPYRVEPLGAPSEGLLTSYFEPMFDGARSARPGFGAPLYRPPPTLAQRKPWYTRQEMETLPEARAQLAGSEIAFLADPVDALILQIQGSGRVRMAEADGSQRLVRLAFAGTNEQPYRSPGKWLIDQGLLRGDVTWPGIRGTLAANPQALQGFLWSNPRMVFFREEPLSPLDAQFGPKGAQGVALTPGRSIAVDPQSIPYGTPVWLSSQGPVANLQRLVMAQDTGNAIVGAVRADYFAGWGAEAGDFAGRMKQPLKLWVLWPR
ncbi:murein transglycosylase A [Ottowia testudinis]|uniref:peptidoglycan lytic exotransglycosylase n=1 Tax=Ottowia testudinis TaxID=2816950 RepID=A0A975H636_9BURK|nr:MltA domain-containing protein [Ottowia testudinis]QTD45602.1 MltA domain-containing protein [Ottowia testudinis]